MTTLEEKLQQPPDHLDEFLHNASRALEYLSSSSTLAHRTAEYSLYRVIDGSQTRLLRPVRSDLYISDPSIFAREASAVSEKLSSLVGSGDTSYAHRIDSVLYTAAQAHYCVFDARLGDSAARKSTGVVFATLLRNVFRAAGVDSRSLSLSLQTDLDVYHYPIDIVANRNRIETTPTALSENDSIFSCMTTTKERLAKVFADKILLERYFGHPVKLGVIALHDVQRKGTTDTTWTFLPNVFLLNWAYLAELTGIFYLDIPGPARATPFRGKVRPLHELVLNFPS